jgi:cytochrome c oxidase subunit 2
MTEGSNRGGPTGRQWAVLLALMIVSSAILIAIFLVIDWFPVAGSNVSDEIDTFWDVLLIVSIPIFVIVTGVMLFSAWRWRQRPGEEELDGPPIHGNAKLEVIWTAVPTVIIAALCAYAAVLLLDIQAAPAKGTRVVNVTGVQFAWSFETNENGKKIKANSLVVPVNEPVQFKVRSNDVIHDFWVPAWRLKVDAVPGITTSYSLTPTRTGTFDVVCAELCGLGHAYMRQNVTVLSKEKYAAWVASQGKAAAPADGGGDAGLSAKELFVAGNPSVGATSCGSCHVLNVAGTRGNTGPNLNEVIPKTDSKAAIVNPNADITKGYAQGIMPANYGQVLTAKEIDELVNYIYDDVQGKG